MAATTRRRDEADRITTRQLLLAGDEFRERRLAAAVSQEALAAACGMSRNHYGRIEAASCRSVTLAELNRIGVELGLAPTLRFYPGGPPIRDLGHARRLEALAGLVRPPLILRFEVALPPRDGVPEQRAWDALLFGDGRRTAMELELRLRDLQALRRRVDLKRRDDPTDGFVLLVADTSANRRVLREFEAMFADLPRLRPSVVRAALAAGHHPPTGLLLV